jgi:hypothetical protein
MIRLLKIATPVSALVPPEASTLWVYGFPRIITWSGNVPRKGSWIGFTDKAAADAAAAEGVRQLIQLNLGVAAVG